MSYQLSASKFKQEQILKTMEMRKRDVISSISFVQIRNLFAFDIKNIPFQVPHSLSPFVASLVSAEFLIW